MFVNAPRLSTNGSVSVYGNHLTAYSSSSRFNTQAEAEAAMGTPNRFTSQLSGSTRRAHMTGGIVGYRKYRNTDYSCDYMEYSSKGHYNAIYRVGKFFGKSTPLGFGFSGFHDAGIGAISVQEIDPTGILSTPIALYNRFTLGNVENRCKVECRLKAAQLRLDASETLAGLSQTMLMIASRSSQVLKALACVKRGNILGALRHLGLDFRKFTAKTPAALWLELQYGWLPLLGDIFAGTELVKEILDPKRNPQQFYALRRGQTELMLGDPAIPAVWKDPTIEKMAMGNVEVKYRFAVTDAFWAYLNSLSILNPLYVAWIVNPFTFVVDWFLPIGAMLQAFTSTVGLKFTSGYISTTASGGITVQASSQHGYIPVKESGTASASIRVAYLRRTRLTAFPGIAPYYRWPFSSERKMTSALALLTQLSR